MYGLVQHDKPDIKSPLLKTAPARVVQYDGDTGVMAVVTADILCCLWTTAGFDLYN